MSLAKTVQFLIENDPSLQDALERGYANFSAVARLLKPKVEEFLGRKVTLEGIITSVKRAKAMYKPTKEYLKIVANSVINLRTDVAKISIEKTRRNLERARLVSADFPEAFFQVLEGVTTLTLITEQNIFNSIRSTFKKEEILDEKENMAALIVQSPKGIVDTPGCIAAFYNPLSRRRINIEETVSCFTETIIVLRMEDATRAFALLTEFMANSRKMLDSG
jgi:aspartokinase